MRGCAPSPELPPQRHDGNRGIYAVVDQMVFRLPDEGERSISVFARAALSPSDRNLVDVYLEGKIIFTGSFALRPEDVLGVALAYTGISKHAAAFHRGGGVQKGLPVIFGSPAHIS